MRLLGENRYPWACWGKREEWEKKLQKCVCRCQNKALFFHANTNIFWLLSWHTVEAGTSLTFFLLLEWFSSYWVALSRSCMMFFYLVLLHLAFSCLAVISSRTVQCWRGNRGSGSREQEDGVWVGEVEGGETVVWLYYMIEESFHYLVFSLLFIFYL